MAAMTPEGDMEAPPPAPPGAPEAQRHARYNHLLGRLRSRQITMEEATELFALMQAMLRASELAARRAATAPTVPSAAPAAPAAYRGRVPGPSSAPDDMFLVGLLAMGAGAGLLAAMARRLGDVVPPRDAVDKGPTVRRGP
ncbi:MAG TPA: hypothetical protein VEH10_06515 [Thermoplasmata archaeon]|nr:hypothetical protein [Thermoplasmata archaeon]